MIGGPLDQWGRGEDDGYMDNGDDVVFLGPMDSVESACYAYRRDKENPLTEDGRDRWIYDEELSEQALTAAKLIGPEAPKPTIFRGSEDEQLPDGMERHVVTLAHNEQRGQWELRLDDICIATVPTGAIRNRDDAEEFRSQYINAEVRPI